MDHRPAVPWTSLLAIIFVGALMASFPWEIWVRFIVWLIIGLIIYFTCGRHHRKLAQEKQRLK